MNASKVCSAGGAQRPGLAGVDVHLVEAARRQRRGQPHQVDRLAGGDQPGHRGVDRPVHGVEEVVGLQPVHHVAQSPRIPQHRTQHRGRREVGHGRVRAAGVRAAGSGLLPMALVLMALVLMAPARTAVAAASSRPRPRRGERRGGRTRRPGRAVPPRTSLRVSARLLASCLLASCLLASWLLASGSAEVSGTCHHWVSMRTGTGRWSGSSGTAPPVSSSARTCAVDSSAGLGGGGRVHRCGDRSTSTRCAGGDTGGGTRRVPRTAWSADADAVGVQVTSARAAAAAGSPRSSAAAARAAAAR